MKLKQKENIPKNEDSSAYDDVTEVVQSLFVAMADIIEANEILKDKNFGIVYQNGHMGYMDLDLMKKKLEEAKEKEKIGE